MHPEDLTLSIIMDFDQTDGFWHVYLRIYAHPEEPMTMHYWHRSQGAGINAALSYWFAYQRARAGESELDVYQRVEHQLELPFDK